MRIGLVTPFPPPRGGVSVHSQRLKAFLEEHGDEVLIFNANTVNTTGGKVRRKLSHLFWLSKFLFCPRCDILHLHILPRWWERAFILLVARRRGMKTVLTIHSLRDDWDQLSSREKSMANYVIQTADYLIFTNQSIESELVGRFNRTADYCTLSPFIAPPQQDGMVLPVQLESFIRDHTFIISANASNMNFFEGIDLYGLDMFIELAGRFHDQKDIGFVYCLTRLTDKNYFAEMQSRIKELDIEDSILIVLDSIEFWPVLGKSHIFVRPTCSDSFGVSIAEALTLGVPSVASNVCMRPDGTIVFESRDGEDMYSKVWHIMNDYDDNKAAIQDLDFTSCADAIKTIYQDLIKS